MVALFKEFLKRQSEKRWVAARRRAIVEMAAWEFEKVRGERPHLGVSSILREDDSMYIVRICYSNTRPHRRSWFQIGKADNTIEEIDFETSGDVRWR